MRRGFVKTRREPTIALINIVFLMLVFFMVAGTLAPPLDQGVELVDTAGLEGQQPPDAPVLRADGRLMLRGRQVTPAEVVTAEEPIRIVPDRAVPARDLLRIAAELRAAGASEVRLVTARGLD